MNLQIESDGQIDVVLIPEKNLAANNAAAFKEAMAPVLQTNKRVVLNLSQLQFIDSSGLGAILSCLKKLHALNGALNLCCASKPILSLFELVRLNRVFSIYETQEAAVSAFK